MELLLSTPRRQIRPSHNRMLISFLYDLIAILNSTGASLNPVILSYTLTPQAEYPTLLTHPIIYKSASDLIMSATPRVASSLSAS